MSCLKRIIPLLLSFALLLGLAACGEDTGANRGKADPIQSGTSAGSAGKVEKDYTAEYNLLREGYTKEIAGFAPDDVLFTVNGDDVTAEEFLYQFTSLCVYFSNQYANQGGILDLNEKVSEDMTVGEYLTNMALNNTVYQTVVEQQAEELEISLTDEQTKEWEKSLAAYQETNGESGYARLLAMYGVSDEFFRRINTGAYLEENVLASIIPEPTEADLDMYIEVSDTLAAKHILLCTVEKGADGKLQFSVTGNAAVSPEGESYKGDPEEINKQILARAEDALKQIREADDPIAKFDELMHALSQDGGLATNPDGYTFSAGQMVEEFENTTRELDYNAVSDVVKSVYGYHIILRLKPDVREAYISDFTIMQQNAWVNGADVEKTDLFESFDPAEAFEKYGAYQQRILAVEPEQ